VKGIRPRDFVIVLVVVLPTPYIVLVLVVVLVLDSRRCSRFPPRLRVTQRSVWRQDKQRRREESVEDEDDDEYENDIGVGRNDEYEDDYQTANRQPSPNIVLTAEPL
jgi:hypothetical protein